MNSSPLSCAETARRCLVAGLSLVPIKLDGSKAPLVAWKEFQKRLPTEAERAEWFRQVDYGIALICGAVSGNVDGT